MKKNLWRLFLEENSHINFIKDRVEEFAIEVDPDIINDFDQFFILDGTDPPGINQILETMFSSSDVINIPKNINKNAKTFFGWATEQDLSDSVFEATHKLCSLFDLDNNQFYFVNSCITNKIAYEKYLRTHIVQQPIQNFVYRLNVNYHNPLRQLNNFKITEIPDNDKKLFITLNKTPRVHRFLLIVLLNYYDLISQGHISSCSAASVNNKYSIDHRRTDFNNHLYLAEAVLSTHKNLKEILKKFENLKDFLPLKIDNHSIYDATNLIQTEKQIHETASNSLFHLITETTYNNDEVAFTEKTFRPIALCRPFLLLGSENSLKHLKSLGFKTFHPYIDETYDSVKEISERTEMVVYELAKLNSLRNSNPNKFYSVYKKMKEIAEYNKQIFIQKDYGYHYKQHIL